MKLKSRLQYLMYFDSKTLLKYFGLLVILCFGFISITKADYSGTFLLNEPKIIEDQTSTNTFLLEENGNFLINEVYNIFGFKLNNGYNAFFWAYNSGLNYTGLYFVDRIGNGVYGGRIRNFFLINNNEFSSFIDAVNTNHCYGDEFAFSGSRVPVAQIVLNENLKYSYPDSLYFYALTYGTRFICFHYSNLGEYLCAGVYSTIYEGECSQIDTSNPLNIPYFTNNGIPDIAYAIGYNAVSSPFVGNGGGSSGGPDYTDLNPHTNSSIYDMYAEKGYTRGLCYSDRGLDNLGTSSGGFDQFYGGDLDDGVYYTGATIFDLYNYNSGGRSLYEWLDFWNTNYQNSISRNNPVNYYNRPKGLWYWFYKYNTIYKRNIGDELNFTTMYNYCSYFLNYNSATEGDDTYTGPTLPSGVDTRSPLDFLLNPPAGSLLDKFRNGQFGTGGSGSGSNSGSGSSNGSGSIDEEMEQTFDSWFETTSNLINLDSIEGVVGILPRYIVVAFVGSLVFYILRK